MNIRELAPTMVAAQMSGDEIVEMSKREVKEAPAPEIAPKRYRMVADYLSRGVELDDAARLSCVPMDVAKAVADEMAAVRVEVEAKRPIDTVVAEKVDEEPIKGGAIKVP